jgi:hypothetical protein
MNEFSNQQKKDLRLLARFIGLYCGSRHESSSRVTTELGLLGLGKDLLCQDCRDLFAYAVEKRRKCPLDPKPSCKNCRIHCYSREYREKIREIMAFSGKKMILRGRLDLLWHYFF